MICAEEHCRNFKGAESAIHMKMFTTFARKDEKAAAAVDQDPLAAFYDNRPKVTDFEDPEEVRSGNPCFLGSGIFFNASRFDAAIHGLVTDAVRCIWPATGLTLLDAGGTSSAVSLLRSWLLAERPPISFHHSCQTPPPSLPLDNSESPSIFTFVEEAPDTAWHVCSVRWEALSVQAAFPLWILSEALNHLEFTLEALSVPRLRASLVTRSLAKDCLLAQSRPCRCDVCQSSIRWSAIGHRILFLRRLLTFLRLLRRVRYGLALWAPMLYRICPQAAGESTVALLGFGPLIASSASTSKASRRPSDLYAAK
ncbi:hypothetical protein AK812_SmicGene6221 [Symbiodinium microadriaticum]|uniref:Uncharacterized protein n=1 Tax=Symbiodinium microadriaticum TaxID=2951 RepID=A0A1Q9ERM4_SYMMI|nr:hypothetical protein AK812_SmicGene6221 [Symbiodinium microadriaticum]